MAWMTKSQCTLDICHGASYKGNTKSWCKCYFSHRLFGCAHLIYFKPWEVHEDFSEMRVYLAGYKLIYIGIPIHLTHGTILYPSLWWITWIFLSDLILKLIITSRTLLIRKLNLCLAFNLLPDHNSSKPTLTSIKQPCMVFLKWCF